MSTKDPFAEVNPFLQLDKKLYLRGISRGGAPLRQDRPKPSVKEVLPSPRQEANHARDGELLPADEYAPDFARAMLGVRPLKTRGRDIPLEAGPSVAPEPRQESFRALLESAPEFTQIFSEEYVEGHVIGLESLVLQKLRAGRYSPEAHLDLHGLNARQAYDALIGFVRHSWYRGMRVLLLIPGRGKNSPAGVAVLRERAQTWLTQEPLKRVVLAFCTARAVDGGPGSLYVLLRKRKKRGKICWERSPADIHL